MTLEWQTVSAPGPEGLFAESSVTFLWIEFPQAQLGLISEEEPADTAAEAAPHSRDASAGIPGGLAGGTGCSPHPAGGAAWNPGICRLLLGAYL